MARLPDLTATIIKLKELGCDDSVIAKAGKKCWVEITKSGVEFTDGEFTYRYAVDAVACTVSSSDAAGRAITSDISIYSRDKTSYQFTNMQTGEQNAYARYLFEDNGTTVELVSYFDGCASWTKSGLYICKLTRESLERFATSDPSIPERVRTSLLHKTLNDCMREARCLKHIDKVLPLLIALKMPFQKLIILAAQNNMLF